MVDYLKGLAEKMVSIQEEIKNTEEELEHLEALNRALLIKERLANDEVQDAQKELIYGLQYSRDSICVKRMGQLDEKPFWVASKRVNNSEDADKKAAELCSLWEEHLRDPYWHPYKVIKINCGTAEEVIDENDEKLKGLKAEHGDEVYQAVITALNELNEHNPSGRFPVPVLWNNKEKRTASLKEGVQQILREWKKQLHKRKFEELEAHSTECLRGN